jgi:hypothetical protein
LKASELIAKLQALVREHGDREITVKLWDIVDVPKKVLLADEDYHVCVESGDILIDCDPLSD